MFNKFKNFVQHYFLPHYSNNYRAKFLHANFFVIYIIFLLIIQIGLKKITVVDSSILGYATNITIEEILRHVNEERQKNGLKPLVLSTELSQAAMNKATDMFKNDYWAHISPTGVTPWDFISESGYKYIYAGENLAKNFDTSKEVFQAWMNSPTHKANLLKNEYTEIGLAVINGNLMGEETTLVVQEFGSRQIAGNLNQNLQNSQYSSEGSISEEKGIIANINENKERNLLSYIPIHKIKKNFSMIMLEFLLIVLFVDGIFLLREKTLRISSNTLSHIIFFACLFGAMGIAGVGVIL
jgi:hypothetical protein